MAQLIALFNCAGGEIHKTDETEKRREGTKWVLARVHALAFKKKGVCVWREGGGRDGERLTAQKLKAHLARRVRFRLPTREKCQLLSRRLKLL